MTLQRIYVILFVAMALFCAKTFSNPVPEWVTESNNHTQILLDILADFVPEQASSFGIQGIDEHILDLPPGHNQRFIQAYESAAKELSERLETTTKPEVRQDLQILLTSIEQDISSIKLEDEFFLPYYNVSELVFYSLQSLLSDQVDPVRYPAALVRLEKYTGLQEGYTPLTKLARNELEAQLNDAGLLGPLRDELERNLENTRQYQDGIKGLFEKYEIKDYEQAYTTFCEQLDAYDAFLRDRLLPRARDDFKLPEVYYQYRLQTYGVDMPVSELVRRAKAVFIATQNDMTGLAIPIAKEKGWNLSDYRMVLANLKKEQIVGKEILPLYRERIRQLEDIVRQQEIVSLPDRDMIIRLASEAESAGLPAPHLNPPKLIGNTGEKGEFVLPLSIPGKDLVIDDFTFEAPSWTLAVHEGRPGHELQFTALVEKGVSLARAIYAANSVNIEGWALYMEAEMRPYLPLAGQFGSRQHLLLRAARAFLDPGLQTGEISKDQAMRILRNDVGLSEAMVMQEVQRYTFGAPGQATSYFCGYQRMLELRTDTELILGDAFDRRAFHDFILSQGLLPPVLLRKTVMEVFVPQYIDNIE